VVEKRNGGRGRKTASKEGGLKINVCICSLGLKERQKKKYYVDGVRKKRPKKGKFGEPGGGDKCPHSSEREG